MECDICQTLAQQLRSYEMEIDDALKGSSPRGVSVEYVLEESRKTGVLYQHHREKFHNSDMPCSSVPSMEQLMRTIPFWPDDLSGLSDQAVLDYMAENRAWNKRLRAGTTALVNTRLAKTITNEEYASQRSRNSKDAAECWRRTSMLVRDLAMRERESIQTNDSGDRFN
jgi:hypothetical protein